MAKGTDNIKAFTDWMKNKADSEYRKFEYRGRLNRSEIAKEAGIGYSAFKQNPKLKEMIATLENKLISGGVFSGSDTIIAEDEGMEKSCEHELPSNYLNIIEENQRLKGLVESQKMELMRYKELSEVMTELGMILR